MGFTDTLGPVDSRAEDNGAQLAWLIGSESRSVYLYRPGRRVERLLNAARVAGQGPVAGFVLEMTDIWDPDR